VKSWRPDIAVAFAAGLLLAAPVALQAQERRGSQGIPKGHLPPPGECKVWYDDRPPGQQPAPTDCATARRVAARTGGRVIHGGPEGRDDKDRDRDRDCDAKDRAKGECDGRDRDDRDCIDRDRDGRCDYAEGRTYPTTLPDIIGAVIWGRGERPDYVRQWVGNGAVTARYVDADRNGTPEIATFYRSGRLFQRWWDTNRDGRVDRVAEWRGGRWVTVSP
jgi:hypothetical protein